MDNPEQLRPSQPLDAQGAGVLYDVLQGLAVARGVEQMQRHANPTAPSTMEVTGPYSVEHELGIADPNVEGFTLITPVGQGLWGAQETRLRVRKYTGLGADGGDVYQAERLDTNNPIVAYATTPFNPSDWHSKPATTFDLAHAQLLLQRSADAQERLAGTAPVVDMREFELDLLRPASKWQAMKQLGRLIMDDLRRLAGRPHAHHTD